MNKKNPSMLEAVFGTESFFSNISEEHKEVLLDVNPGLYLLSRIYHYTNEHQRILPVASLEKVLSTTKKLSSGHPPNFPYLYFELASDPEQDIFVYENLDVFFKNFNYRLRTCLAIAGYQQREAKQSKGRGLDALDIIRTGIGHINKDSIIMEQFTSFMYAYGKGFTSKFLDEEFAHKSNKSIRRLLFEYELQLTEPEHRGHTLMYYYTGGRLRKGLEIVNPLFE